MTAFVIPWYLMIYYWSTLSWQSIAVSTPLLIWWSVSIALSRIYNGHHFFVDVAGGVALSLLIHLVWITSLAGIMDMLVPSQTLLFPIGAVAVGAGLLYVHPLCKETNPALAESALVIGTGLGGALAFWCRYYFKIPFGFGISLGGPLLEGYPLTLLAARFVVGIVIVGLVREVMKKVGLPILLYLYNNLVAQKPTQPLLSKTNYKYSIVDVVLKFFTYTAISFSVIEIVPHFCWLLGIGHPLDLLSLHRV